MKHKTLIATIAALTMLASSTTVFAETLQGDVNYVNTTVYKVTLPTTAGMSFTLDPQGLSALDVEDGDTSEAAGNIVSTGSMVAKNESSVDVKLSVDFYVTDSQADPALSLVAADGSLTETPVSEDEGAPKKQDKKEIQLLITPDDGDENTTETAFAVTTTAVGTPQEFTMKAATYTFGGNKTDGYTYDLTADTGSTLTMTIGGKVAKDYDWSAYSADASTPASITLNAVFKFKNAAGEEVTNTAPAVIAETTIAGNNYVRTKTDNTYTITWATAVENANKTIKSIYLGTDGTTFGSEVPEACYSLNGNTITIDGTKNTKLGAGGVGSTRYLKVTFGDDSSAVITLKNITEN